MKIRNIAVLAAGTSTERDVSISSGTNVCKALRKKGYNAVVVDIFFGTKDANPFEQADYDIDAQEQKMRADSSRVARALADGAPMLGENVLAICQKADFVFLGLHGQNGEDGRIQAMFDLMGIPYSGTGHLGSAMAMDKGITKRIVTGAGVPMPKGTVLPIEALEEAKNSPAIVLPCVVKPCCGGSSIGVYICHTQEEYAEALEKAFGYENQVVVEAYVKGREFSIGVIDGKALPVIEIIADGWYDYESKYNGKTKEVCPAQVEQSIAKAMQADAVKAAAALKLEGYCRIDFLLDKDGQHYCLEANTLPGMTATSLLPQEAAQIGMDYETLCEHLVQVSMKKYIK
jgi:D-alanine-D-alanine ligase